jgi:ABC-2 type transport system ATP-binding protein
VIFKAVDNITLQIGENEAFGILGPNGAGKTTLIKMLCTLIKPTEGIASINNFDILKEDNKVRSNIGFISSDDRSFYQRLTGGQNLSFFGNLYNLPAKSIKLKISEILHLVGLEGKDNILYNKYSSGEKQKLSIARALLINPAVLFIDELSRSLDPGSALNLRRFIKDTLIAQQHKTVFLATHDLDEALMLCDRVGIMHKGKIRSFWRTDELKYINKEQVLYEIYNEIDGPAISSYEHN